MTLVLFLGMTASATMFSSHSFAIENNSEDNQSTIEPPKEDGPMMPDGLVKRLPIMVDCGPAPVLMTDIVKKYSEVPFASMDVMFRTPQGQVLQGKGTITVNQDTGSWSYIVSFGEGQNICFFISGSNFGPWIDPEATRTNKNDNQIMPREGEMPGVTKRVQIDY